MLAASVSVSRGPAESTCTRSASVRRLHPGENPIWRAAARLRVSRGALTSSPEVSLRLLPQECAAGPLRPGELVDASSPVVRTMRERRGGDRGPRRSSALQSGAHSGRRAAGPARARTWREAGSGMPRPRRPAGPQESAPRCRDRERSPVQRQHFAPARLPSPRAGELPAGRDRGGRRVSETGSAGGNRRAYFLPDTIGPRTRGEGLRSPHPSGERSARLRR